ncbi:MAG: hypothetical protein B6I24_00710 [Bacteroidetes bacterium 4572_128]|nr:MAG: hypothetical protein B6I24_00710 [Bacteroidetes bacterium 4572_128]
MKTTIILKKKSFIQQFTENIKDFAFQQYCFFHTLINHPAQLKKVYWSVTDCYIEIGKSGYISNGRIYDLNGEPEFRKIKKLAKEKKLSIKEVLLLAIDKV